MLEKLKGMFSKGSAKKTSSSSGFFARTSSKLIEFLSQYSLEQEDVVGVDISPTSVRLAQLSRDEDKWSVEKIAFRHIESVEDVKGGAASIVDEIKIALKAGKIKTTNAAVSIPVSSSIIKVISMPLMTEKEIEKAIEFDSLWENLTQLPDAVEEYSIFYQTIRKDSAKNMMDVLFVASKLSEVNNYIDLIKKAGLVPVVMDVRCFALRNSFESLELPGAKERVIAILEIGTHENYLLILKGDDPFVSDIFVSAKDRDMLGAIQTDQSVVESIVDRYVMQINQNITAYTSRFKSGSVDELYIVSQSPNIQAVNEMLSKKLSIQNVTTLNPFANKAVPAQIMETISVEDNKSAFTAVAGLATRKLDIFGYYEKVTGTNNINLLPNRTSVRQTKRTQLFSTLAMAGVAALALLGGVAYGISFYFSSSQNNEALVDYEVLRNELTIVQNEMLSLKQENDEMIGSLMLSETATTNQVAAAGVLNNIAEAAGFNVALTNIDFDGSSKYKLNGEALSDKDVINFVSRMRDNEIFTNVVLEKSSIAKEGSKVKTFIINVKVKDELMKARTISEQE